MQPDKIFERCISAEDAINICYKHSTIDVMYDAYDCYCKAYHKCQPDSGTMWKHNSGLAAVYVLGFISGCRAIRKRKRNKREQA